MHYKAKGKLLKERIFFNSRSLVASLRRLEKEAYAIHKLLLENPGNEEYYDDLDLLDLKVSFYYLVMYLNTLAQLCGHMTQL